MNRGDSIGKPASVEKASQKERSQMEAEQNQVSVVYFSPLFFLPKANDHHQFARTAFPCSLACNYRMRDIASSCNSPALDLKLVLLLILQPFSSTSIAFAPIKLDRQMSEDDDEEEEKK